MKKSQKFAAALPLIILLVFVVFLGIHKDVWFCDEVYTYYSSNGINKINPLASTEWISGTEVKDYFAATSLSDPTFSDISTKLFSDHVPLYFWLFHIISVVFMGSCSKWIGLLINICFCIFVYFLLFGFFHYFNRNSVVFSSLAAAAILLHPLSLTEITTIRMYFMFSACQFAVIYIVARNQQDILNFVLLTISTTCGLLTHYYFWFWIAFFSAFYLLYLLIRESIKSKKIYYYGFSMAAAMALTTVLFRYWKYKLYFHGGKGEVAMENLLKIENIGKSARIAI